MTANNQSIPQQILDTLPLVMRTVAAHMRQSGHIADMPHFRTLGMLSHHQSCNLSELAEKQFVSLPTMSNSISKLVERGWVRRVPDEHDRRMVRIELTSEGKSVLEKARQMVEKQVAVLLGPLSRTDQKKLAEGLTILQKVFAAPEIPELENK